MLTDGSSGNGRAWLELALMSQGVGFVEKSFVSHPDQWRLRWPSLVATMGVAQPPQWHPEGDVWTHSAMTLDFAILAGAPFHLRVAALFHDIGKPPTYAVDEDGRIRFNGHDTLGADLADEALANAGFKEYERERIVTLIRHHMIWGSVKDMKASTRRKLYRKPYFDDLLALHRFDVEAASRDMSVLGFVANDRTEQKERLASRPVPVERLIGGKDVMAAGWPEGPHVGRILAIVEAEQRAGAIQSREAALSRLAELQSGSCC